MDPYVLLAKTAIEKFVTLREIIAVPKGLPDELYSRQVGVFVTLYRQGELRGCIGTFLPVRRNIAAEIISNAVAACSEDYRFDPVVPEELSELEYEVSLLSSPREIRNLDNHDPETDGLIVRSAGRSGLLLPGLEGVGTAEEQFVIACQKGGIDPKEEGIQIFAFRTEKHR